jgi:hypothetical protein
MTKKSTNLTTVSFLKSVMVKLHRNKPSLVLLLIGFIAGILWFGALRFILVHPSETHYHANFAVYVDGHREEFKSFTYYEEIAACTSLYANNPKGRAHMHDNVNNIIHIHDKRVTYADFFANIDWTLGPNFVRTADGLITDTTDKSWVFILNGKKLERVDNLVIGDQDKLLISYGTADTDFSAQYSKIENKAAIIDSQNDPATCGGLNGPGEETFTNRLKRTIDQ